MTDHNPLYSCLISNRPSDGFFSSFGTDDIDGIPVGSCHDPASTPEQEAARSARRHRLVKAAKCPTQARSASDGPSNGVSAASDAVISVAGLTATAGQLQRTKQRQALAAAENWGEWERIARVDYPDGGLGVLRYQDSRWSELEPVEPNLPEFDPTRISDEKEPALQTHRLDLTTGELIRVRRHESGSKCVVEHREWADEFRVRTKVEQAITSLPPEQSGARYTRELSLSGARKISDSCRYMALQHGGFSTFLTLTLDTAARCRVEIRVNHGPCTELVYYPAIRRYRPKCTHLTGMNRIYDRTAPNQTRWVKEGRFHDLTWHTVQKELGRFWDAANKIYQRGWVQRAEGYKKPGFIGPMPMTEHRGEPHDDKLQYCWVVENPKNERGQDNPHVHVLMRWRVPFRDFRAWAARIESLWGQGTGHLEKIKEPEKAGAYMAKAAGYLTKASGDNDQ